MLPRPAAPAVACTAGGLVACVRGGNRGLAFHRCRCVLACFVYFIASQHTLNQRLLQQCTTPPVYVRSKFPSPHSLTLHVSLGAFVCMWGYVYEFMCARKKGARFGTNTCLCACEHVRGVWCVVPGACFVHGAWCVVHGAWCVVRNACSCVCVCKHVPACARCVVLARVSVCSHLRVQAPWPRRETRSGACWASSSASCATARCTSRPGARSCTTCWCPSCCGCEGGSCSRCSPPATSGASTPPRSWPVRTFFGCSLGLVLAIVAPQLLSGLYFQLHKPFSVRKLDVRVASLSHTPLRGCAV